MKFSQRIGKKEIRQVLQTNGIDQVLENRLWNNILKDFIEQIDDYARSFEESDRGKILKYIWENFFELRIDEISSYDDGTVFIQA
ncbi:AbiJ-NTD4 domain-containing protein [Flavobacterium lindanitolerans]|jgi:hypothetical protein|uniref:AbiJ-NTD4 domain-containing protein n=1 Tax=Flavobacterium lindanitolerans TaxID=428988 RepID=UPI0023F2DA2C|nr:hypothetical protein [Flavobacterium lindanitolerans]